MGAPVEVRPDVICSEGMLNQEGPVLDEHGMRIGSFWDEGRIQRALREKGSWSTGICTPVAWDWMQCLAFPCPWLVIYHMLKVSGPVRVVGTRTLHVDRFMYLFAVFAIVVFAGFVPHVKACHARDVYATSASSSSEDDIIRPDGGVASTNTNSTSDGSELECTDYTSLGTEFVSWMLTFVVLAGLREKMGVGEEWHIVMLKSARCLECYMCCQMCYIPQVARHLYTSQGFVQAYVLWDGAGPLARVPANPAPAAQPLVTQPAATAGNDVEEAAE